MSVYSKHQYSYLFEYIEDKVNRLGKDKDYASLLLSMERAVSIDELINIYNEVLEFSASTILGKPLPENWYKITWLQANMTWLFETLNRYLNDNILRLFNSIQCPSKEQYYQCLSNLRECDNCSIIESKILKDALDVDKKDYFSVIAYRKNHAEIRRKIEKEGVGSNENNKQKYIYYSQFLAAHHHVFDVEEISFGKVHRITYEGFADDYYKAKAKEVESRIVDELLKSDKAITEDDILNEIERTSAVEMEEVIDLVSFEEIVKEINYNIDKENQLIKQKQIEEEKRKREMRQRQIADGNELLNKVGSNILAAALSIPLGFLGAIFSNIGKGKR